MKNWSGVDYTDEIFHYISTCRYTLLIGNMDINYGWQQLYRSMNQYEDGNNTLINLMSAIFFYEVWISST